eukprot:gene3279-biopygen419
MVRRRGVPQLRSATVPQLARVALDGLNGAKAAWTVTVRLVSSSPFQLMRGITVPFVAVMKPASTSGSEDSTAQGSDPIWVISFAG